MEDKAKRAADQKARREKHKEYPPLTPRPPRTNKCTPRFQPCLWWWNTSPGSIPAPATAPRFGRRLAGKPQRVTQEYTMTVGPPNSPGFLA